jgi:hypothetical protein
VQRLGSSLAQTGTTIERVQVTICTPPARIYTWGLLHNLVRVSGQRIPPEQVFAMWKLKWFQEKSHLERRFTEEPGLEAQFLARPEVTELSKMSRGTVRRAIDVDHRLEVILKAAKNPPPQPKSTSTQYPENVYISSGGGAFHRIRNCAALGQGQRSVSRRGGTPTRVNPIPYRQAKARGMEPCQACFPPNWNR